MAIATQVRKRFEAGFDSVWRWLDAKIPDWRTRQVIPALDAVLVLADETIPADADAARSAAERVIGYVEAEESTPVGRPRRRGRSGSYVELRQQARGVLASAMIVQKVTSQPFKLLDTTIRATETPEIKASLLTRRSYGRLEVAEWNGALKDAQAAVEAAQAGHRILGDTTVLFLGVRGTLFAICANLMVIKPLGWGCIGSGRHRAYPTMEALKAAGVGPAQERIERALEVVAKYTPFVRPPWRFLEGAQKPPVSGGRPQTRPSLERRPWAFARSD